MAIVYRAVNGTTDLSLVFSVTSEAARTCENNKTLKQIVLAFQSCFSVLMSKKTKQLHM